MFSLCLPLPSSFPRVLPPSHLQIHGLVTLRPHGRSPPPPEPRAPRRTSRRTAPPGSKLHLGRSNARQQRPPRVGDVSGPPMSRSNLWSFMSRPPHVRDAVCVWRPCPRVRSMGSESESESGAEGEAQRGRRRGGAGGGPAWGGQRPPRAAASGDAGCGWGGLRRPCGRGTGGRLRGASRHACSVTGSTFACVARDVRAARGWWGRGVVGARCVLSGAAHAWGDGGWGNWGRGGGAAGSGWRLWTETRANGSTCR